MNICFDINECLIDREEKPIKSNIALLRVLSKKHKIYAWSGKGWGYAESWTRLLGLSPYLSGVLNKYGTFRPDIAFDDQEIDLGKLNIQLCPVS